jgi:uncharacterized protein YbjT (DUF2867 family)
LVRDPSSAAAQHLTTRGVQLYTGSFYDEDSVIAAARGATGLFSMQLPGDGEVRAARNLVTAAERADVTTLVHTSVARAGDHEQFLGWSEGRWPRDYWLGKHEANEAVRHSTVPYRVILKPAFMMDNFATPKSDHMFPTLSQGRLATAYEPETRLDLIAAADVGRVAADAFEYPERFHRQEIDLAAESLTMAAIARVLTEVTGTDFSTTFLRPSEAVGVGYSPGVVDSQRWATVEGYQVDIRACRDRGIRLDGFAAWAMQHRARLR